MKRYYFQLLNESYDDLGALIPDGSNKQTAVNRLYRKGVNICKGCERENNGSCTIVHLGICDEQAARHIQAIKRVTTYNV